MSMTPLEMLRMAFEEKKNRNSRFSLRSFARQMDMDPSTLSKILLGKRGVPASKVAILAEMFFENDRDKIRFIEKTLQLLSRRNNK